ncbi:MAG: cupin domain-containing protein [Candidatus Latescibacterota bacterium]|nr:cupin domain-containing protein [Candidatus Latescibacterota bacterium]
MVIRHWQEVTPYVGHETALIWPIFRAKGSKDLSNREAPLLGTQGFTLHRMQAGMEGDYHDHKDREQIYYFTDGRGKMKIDGEIYAVRKGDSVHIPPKSKHQLINDSDKWIEHLIITAVVGS